jgi:hypothetical protein
MSYNYQKKDIAGSSLHVYMCKMYMIYQELYQTECFLKVFLLFEDSPKRQQKHVKGQVLFSQSRFNIRETSNHTYIYGVAYVHVPME